MLLEVKRLFDMTGTFRRFVILTLLRLPFDTLFNIINALFLKYAFDAVNGAGKNGLMIACALFGVGNIFLFLYNGTVWTLYATNVTKWVGTIRRKLFSHVSGLPLQQIESRPIGEWMTRLNADVQAATAMLNQSIHLPHAVVAIVNICASSLILILMDPRMFGLIMLFVVPHILINRIFVTKPMTRFAINVQEVTAKNTNDMNTLVTCADIAILYDFWRAHGGFSVQNWIIERLDDAHKQLDEYQDCNGGSKAYK